MAKKSTVGGPKSRRTTNEDLERRKQYRSRAEREKLFQRRVMIATGTLSLLAGILFWRMYEWMDKKKAKNEH